MIYSVVIRFGSAIMITPLVVVFAGLEDLSATVV
jgi:hypothetical protein